MRPIPSRQDGVEEGMCVKYVGERDLTARNSSREIKAGIRLRFTITSQTAKVDSIPARQEWEKYYASIAMLE